LSKLEKLSPDFIRGHRENFYKEINFGKIKSDPRFVEFLKKTSPE